MRGEKSANSKLFKDFFNEAEMEKNKTDGEFYFVIVPHTIVSGYQVGTYKPYDLTRAYSRPVFLSV